MTRDEEFASREARLEVIMFRAWQRELGDTNEKELSHLRNCIKVAVKEALTPKQREYLSYYMSGYNLVEISKIYNVNRSTVSKTMKRALDHLFDHIKYATPTTLKTHSRVRKYLVRLYQ